MEENKKIGKFILEERRNINLTQEDLANKLYVTRSTISKWERGVSLPDYDLILKLCEIFNITVDEFFVGERKKVLAKNR